MAAPRAPGDASVPADTLLVTGFLGAGKTTLLSGWLAARPAHERWAVLVNEFGALGIDRALLGGDGGSVEIAEVAGGCACCAAQVAFSATLTRLLRRGPWDRLLVETTGLGHPAALVDLLRAPGLGGLLRVRPPVAVVDARRAALYLDPGRSGHALALEQVTLSRAIVLNRAGSAEPERATEPEHPAALAQRLAALPPWPRPVIPTSDGTVPLDTVLAALDAPDAPDAPGSADVAGTAGASAQAVVARLGAGRFRRAAGLPARTDAATDATGTAPAPAVRSAARRWPADVVFERARLQAALAVLTAADGPLRACGLLRAKGVFRTARAWYGWQWTDGGSGWQETTWRADSRIELLAERAIDPQMVDDALRTAVRKG